MTDEKISPRGIRIFSLVLVSLLAAFFSLPVFAAGKGVTKLEQIENSRRFASGRGFL